MQIGAVFPQNESGSDPEAMREYVVAVEDAGCDFIAAYDHVLGANPDRPDPLTGPYTHRDYFQEVFVFLGWVAAMTRRLGLVTEILILPQRPTALVAKQAAELAVLSGDRLRLGVGLGWNHVEYEALGTDFHNRGRRIEEQIEVLRLLWANELVTFEGRWHQIPDAGILPLPPARSIPVWMGGSSEPARRRAARIADGWMLNGRVRESTRHLVEEVREWVAEAGRDPAAFGIAGRVFWTGDLDDAVAQLEGWRQLDATHVSMHTMGACLTSLREHAEVVRRFREAAG